MTEQEQLAEALVPVAAELVATVRDYGPDDVHAILARVPEGRHDALAVVLAAMVDPDKTPHELLGWTDCGPVISRGDGIDPVRQVATPGRFPREHGTERGYQQHRHRKEMPACEPCRIAHSADVRARLRKKRNGAVSRGNGIEAGNIKGEAARCVNTSRPLDQPYPIPPEGRGPWPAS